MEEENSLAKKQILQYLSIYDYPYFTSYIYACLYVCLRRAHTEARKYSLIELRRKRSDMIVTLSVSINITIIIETIKNVVW